MNRTVWNVSLQVRGPVMTKSSAIGAPGFDAVMARGSFKGANGIESRYYLPGSLIKGLLREAWQELSFYDGRYGEWCERWLGKGSCKPDDTPERGQLQFTDFVDYNTPTDGEKPTRYRIQVEEMRGAAAGQMIQMMESPYAPGCEINYLGSIRTVHPEAEMKEAIERGLLWVQAVGGSRSIGFGQILNVSLSEQSTPATSSSLPDSSLWRLRLSFDRPVLFSKRRISGNLFESGEIMPGAVLTGAIANAIQGAQGFGDLASGLSALHFTHAFPAPQGKNRPTVPPLSLIRDSDNSLQDAIRMSNPPTERCKFRIDWKEDEIEDVLRQSGWPANLTRELRVRTAISGEIRKAKDEDLFAWQAVVPHGYEWIAIADVSGLSEAARKQLAAVLEFGVEPLGKTKAYASVCFEGEEAPALQLSKDYQIVLQSPALLIDPREIEGARRGEEVAKLRAEYERVWQQLSSSLRLINYFGACSLAGGEYFYRRFQQPNGYKPYLLSEAGTTFLLEAAPGCEEQARKAIEGLLRTGMPIRDVLCDYYGIPKDRKEQWKCCPYAPNNGYGEVVLKTELMTGEA